MSAAMHHRSPKGVSYKSLSSDWNSKPYYYRNAGPSNAETTQLESRKPREDVAERMYKAGRESENVVAVIIHYAHQANQCQEGECHQGGLAPNGCRRMAFAAAKGEAAGRWLMQVLAGRWAGQVSISGG